MPSTCFRNLKLSLMNGNCSQTLQTHNRYNKYHTYLVFSVRTVSYGSLFFPLRFRARVPHAWAINRRGKNLVHNLWYWPRTWLVRGIYWTNDIKSAAICRLNCWLRKPGLGIFRWGCVIFGERKNKELIFSFKSLKIFWINNKAILLNLAFVAYEEFCRSQRVLSTLAFPWSAEFFYPTQRHSIIATYTINHSETMYPNLGFHMYASRCLVICDHIT